MDTDMALRLVAIPGVLFEGETVDTLLYDEELGATWSVTFDGAPPLDHMDELDGVGLGAFEVMLAYADNNSSGTFDDGDAPVSTACLDGKGALVVWIPEVSSLDAAWTFGVYGLSTGWSILLNNDGEGGAPTVLDEADYGSLVVDEDCTLG